MSVQDWQKRLFTRSRELRVEHDLLLTFMESDTFPTLPENERNLLMQESDIIHQYIMVLARRIMLLPRGVSYE